MYFCACMTQVHTTAILRKSSDALKPRVGNAGASDANERSTDPLTLTQENINSIPVQRRRDKNHSSETVSWSFLPSKLQNPAKAMLRRRTLASLVAAEAQKEAITAANLVKCLRMFGELCSSASHAEPHESLNKFFSLYELIEQENVSIVPMKDRLVPLSSTPHAPENMGKSGKKTLVARGKITTKAPKTSKELRVADKLEWAEGDGLREGKQLREILLDETQSWFLEFLERALDVGFQMGSLENVKGKGKNQNNIANKIEPSTQIAVTLSQLKNANEWLDKLRSKMIFEKKGGVAETIDGLKQKIYSCLLVHVDSAAFALEHR